MPLKTIYGRKFEMASNELSQENSSNSHTDELSLFGRTEPHSRLAFVSQTVILLIVIIASIVNISLGVGDEKIWITLLSTSLGVVLPNPSVKLGWLPK